MKNKGRNGEIDILRFVFTLCVIFAHFKSQYENVALLGRWNGHISVEFFFVLSGFLMVARAEKNSTEEPIWKKTLDFLHRKISSLAPVYYTTLLFVVILYLSNSQMTVTNLRTYLTRLVPSLLFLSSQGLEESTSIPFSWYICSMLLAMFIIYPVLIILKRNYTCILAPLISIFICAFAMQQYGKLFMLQQDWFVFFYPSLLRAILGINVGCIAYEISSHLKKTYSSKMTKVGRCFFTAITICMFLFPILWIIKGLDGRSHLCVLLMFGLGVAFCFSRLGFNLIGGQLTDFIGKFCLPLYLGQGLTMKLFPTYLASEWFGAVLYLLACFIVAFGLLFASKAFTIFGVHVQKTVKKICFVDK